MAQGRKSDGKFGGKVATDKPPAAKRRRGQPDLETAAAAKAAADTVAPPAPEPPRDEPPAPAPRRRRRSRSTTTKAIADALAEILTMPAVPCAIVGDQWAAEHFTVQGRDFAEKIAAVSERNDVLRKWCERALEGESVAVLLMGSVMYAYPPLLHWGLLPGPPGLFGVPQRPPRRREPIVPPPPARPEPEVWPIEPEPELGAPGFEPGNGTGPLGPDDLADVSVHMLEDET